MVAHPAVECAALPPFRSVFCAWAWQYRTARFHSRVPSETSVIQWDGSPAVPNPSLE